jgi:3-oxo-5-alpha-steroid 4-dehydrogenase 1
VRGHEAPGFALIELPDWTPFAVALHLAFAGYAVLIVPLGRLGLLRMRYSKFRTGAGIDSRAGMLLLYGLPIVSLVVTSLVVDVLPGPSSSQLLVIGLLAIHFGKRCFEAVFVHKYSGPIDIQSVALIGANYSLVTAVAAIAIEETPPIDAFTWLGVVLFAAGELANLHHHRLLARLRRSESGYLIPRGALFEVVSAPHYLVELVAWLGIALVAHHLIFYLILAIMVVYLGDRAAQTHAWYRERFPDYPPRRRRILPGVF